MNVRQIFLLVTAMGLVPIALSYGMAPQVSLDYLFDMPVSGVNATHIFRAVMGLYLALIVFWIAGAFRAEIRQAALYSLVIFMIGLAAGRVLSLAIDGVPNGVLLFYLAAELLSGVVGLLLLKRSDQ